MLTQYCCWHSYPFLPSLDSPNFLSYEFLQLLLSTEKSSCVKVEGNFLHILPVFSLDALATSRSFYFLLDFPKQILLFPLLTSL